MISKKLFRAQMVEGSDVSMINGISLLDALEFSMNPQLLVDLILQSLPESFVSFITYFYMNKIKCFLLELLNMLIIAQSQMKDNG